MAEEVSNVKPNKATLETVDYKAQMEDFFINVKRLHGSSLNPKLELPTKHVTAINIKKSLAKLPSSKPPTLIYMWTQRNSCFICVAKSMACPLLRTTNLCHG